MISFVAVLSLCWQLTFIILSSASDTQIFHPTNKGNIFDQIIFSLISTGTASEIIHMWNCWWGKNVNNGVLQEIKMFPSLQYVKSLSQIFPSYACITKTTFQILHFGYFNAYLVGRYSPVLKLPNISTVASCHKLSTTFSIRRTTFTRNSCSSTVGHM